MQDFRLAKTLAPRVKGLITGPVTLVFSTRIKAPYSGYRDEQVYLDTADALLDIARFWRPPRPLTPARSSFAQLNPAIDAVLRSGSLISTQTAARSCGMNRMQFSRSFQATMGLSFADFSRRHRLDAAVHRMLAGREPIKAIARATGFCDESHFCRMFIRYYHCTPREYRLRYGAPG